MDLNSEAFGRHAAASASFPDLMNDPAYATNARDKGKGREVDDPDTCRICRGEGTTEEPLFYPCKCSGSIKFVHQACLVEWLSHSQKKYCELCKTPFQFTKLYDPNMPADIPAPLFARQILVHGIRTVLTWLRLLLVAFVWLGWLPWSMRAIWRALFWLADGQWSTIELSPDMARLGSNETQLRSVATIPGSMSSAASQSASAIPAQVTSSELSVSSMLSFTASEPLMLTLIKKVFSIIFIPTTSVSGATSNSSSNNAASSAPRQRHPSWLSDVKFFNSLTPYPTFNNILIDTLEGQLITLLVVIAFILVFLIREWVVQQQPLANIAEAERDAAVRLIENNRPEQMQEVREAERQDPASPPVVPDPGWRPIDNIEDRLAVDTDASHPNPPRSSPMDDVHGQTGPALPGESAAAPSLNAPGSGSPAQRGAQNESSSVGAEERRDLRARNLQSETAFNFSGARIPEAFDSFTSADLPGGEASGPAVNPPLNDSADHQNFTFAFPVANGNVGPATRPVSPYGVNDSRRDQDDPSTDGLTAPGAVSTTSSDSTDVSPSAPLSATADVQKNWAEKLSDWFWADVPHPTHGEVPLNDDGPPEDEGPEVGEPFIRVIPHQELADGAGQGFPANAALDADEGDAIEDGDDLEGILELIGMQGPIFGLLQNGVFCAVLISFTVAIAIWLPYLWGKIALVLLANPIQLFLGVPITAVTVVADVAVDTMIGSFGYVLYCVSVIGRLVLKPLAYVLPVSDRILGSYSITNASLSVIDASGQRLRKLVGAFFMFHKSDLPMFSILSHQALKMHEARIASLFGTILAACKFALYEIPLRITTTSSREALSLVDGISNLKSMVLGAVTAVGRAYDTLSHAGLSITPITKWASFERAGEPVPILDHDLAVWNSKDRIIAIAMGYMLATTLGLLYLRITALFRGPAHGQRVDGMVAEVLHQAGGVMKVILIIGIEMIVFPLYCGSLLDAALLPLFKDATLASRVQFTTSSPLTSIFVHWFVGTCYMFHFALFVSMCRKIMRSGVLYFIRDPDDPTFHPVRDVLERNIGTQLRKIAFSALVYGALVIVCLGGVVWGLYLAFDGVLPVHWSATVPVLEFPVDLLFYNFVMPLAIRVLKPSDTLHDLYNWWFHKCARFLRLTNFFFGDRRPDEEGRHVRRSWWDALTRKKGDINNPVVGEEQRVQAEQEGRDVYFLRDGRFVRAPASDQVRIPKGTRVFVDVSETNERLDGAADSEDGLHGRASDMFTQVYIPPYFQLRIAAFIFLIWVFAAATGVGTTIVPLVIGRKIISSCVAHMRPVNDLYAFSAGLCVVGSVAYLAFYCRQGAIIAYGRLRQDVRSPHAAATGLLKGLTYVAQLVYLFAAVSVVLPSILALLTELYVFIPMDTYFNPGKPHVIHFVQDWTLGVLYVQMAVKFTLWNSRSRPAAALKAITRDGWFRPNVRLATRALIFPLTLFAILAVTAPLCLGLLLASTVFRSSPGQIQTQVYRYCYPAVLLVGLTYWVTHLIRRRLEVWRVNIRDEVYLIGERLHNFSEKRAKEVGMSRRVIT